MSKLDKLREAGWAVAVHNDYRQGGEAHTFWLFTKDGRCVKGEGRTDEEALTAVMEEVFPSPESLRSGLYEYDYRAAAYRLTDTRLEIPPDGRAALARAIEAELRYVAGAAVRLRIGELPEELRELPLNRAAAGALLWLRNHYDSARSRGDENLRAKVIARIDKVLARLKLSVQDSELFRLHFPFKG